MDARGRLQPPGGAGIASQGLPLPRGVGGIQNPKRVDGGLTRATGADGITGLKGTGAAEGVDFFANRHSIGK